MNKQVELRKEKEYTALVQQLLLAVIEQYKGYADFHDDNIRMMLSDAWEELRMKPTALSPQDLEQLSTEINRILARRAFTADLVGRYERMLLNPFFGRIDFVEEGQQGIERIVVGLYSLKNKKGELMVHDWRAPVCSLYYDASPGPVSYQSPSGIIAGRMTLKRQYRMEDGRLKFFVDTDVSIDDAVLLDILSSATSTHMRSIVSTIQREQNVAIRQEKAKVLSVVGSAGSGKTSVAMHRAAYLMYHQRTLLDASRVAVLSPGSAFTEYISTVLPDLGEENTRAFTMHEVLSGIISSPVETALRQNDWLLAGDALRRESVELKTGAAFAARIERFCDDYRNHGPEFEQVCLGKHMLATRAELERMYRVEFRMLSPALRLIRLQTVLSSRLEAWEKTLRTQYEERLFKSYRGRELDMAARLAVSQQLQPVRAQIRQMLECNPLTLFAQSLEGLSEALHRAALENVQAKLIWWEDAPAIGYMMLRLGFAKPDKQILHLLIDEAQDYSDVALLALKLYCPSAHITLLGDPNQRTTPGMPPCDARAWGGCFGEPDAPVVTLSKCYRSTLPITRLCNALLPLGEKSEIFGREGDWPAVEAYAQEKLLDRLASWKGRENLRTLAVITRRQKEAAALHKLLPGGVLLTGESDDMLPDAGGVVVGGYHVMKGLEFDAVAVVWPRCEPTDDELRRLYTACSRALHALALMADDDLIKKLGIVL